MLVAPEGILQLLVKVVDYCLLHLLDPAFNYGAVFIKKLLSRKDAVATGAPDWGIFDVVGVMLELVATASRAMKADGARMVFHFENPLAA